MRGLRSTIVLLVVLVGLGAYIYFVTWKQGENDTGTKQEKLFASLEADKIEDLKVKSESGDVTSVKKEGGGWQVVAPIAVQADESEVSGITTALGQMEIVRVIDEDPADLKEYGLETPRIEIDFKAGGDKDFRRLLIGEKSPTGANLYAKRNDEKRVFLILAFQESALNRSTFDLREKTLIKFDRDKVDGIEVNTGGKTLQLAKDSGEWKLTRPLTARADFGTVEGLVGRIQTVRMKSIVADSPAPGGLKKYGLDTPEVTVNLNLGSARATLLLGGKADETSVYARDASRPAVMTVESALANDLKKGTDDYRPKNLFEFRAHNATRVEITRSGQTVVFERIKGQGDNPQDKWRRVSPNAADVDKDKTDSTLAKIADLRATSFVESTAKTGLPSPVLTAFVKFDDGKKEERVSFGRNDNDVYAARPGESGAAKIDAADFTDVTTALDELSK